jgi:hypothetical protein
MNQSVLILVSVDDHIVEPSNMFDAHLSAAYRTTVRLVCEQLVFSISQLDSSESSKSRRVRFPLELPYSDALRDLVRSILRHATPAQTIEWAHTARAWFGMAWDVGNAGRQRPPSVNDYLMMRMHTGGLGELGFVFLALLCKGGNSDLGMRTCSREDRNWSGGPWS